MSLQFRYTRIDASVPVGKSVSVNEEGCFKKQPAKHPHTGVVTTETVSFDQQGFDYIFSKIEPTSIIVYGEPITHVNKDGDEAVSTLVVSSVKKRHETNRLYSRTKECTTTDSGSNYLLAFDFDPSMDFDNISVENGVSIIGEAFKVPDFDYIALSSTSSRVLDKDKNAIFPGGFRIFALINGGEYQDAKPIIVHHSISAGTSKVVPTKVGSINLKHVFDTSVMSCERIDYSLTPPSSVPDICSIAPLVLLASRFNGVPLTSKNISMEEIATGIKSGIAIIRSEYQTRNRKELTLTITTNLLMNEENKLLPEKRLKAIVNREVANTLKGIDGTPRQITNPNLSLHFKEDFLGAKEWPVGRLIIKLASDGYSSLNGLLLHDPLEPDYDSPYCAKITSSNRRSIKIHSFAHGTQNYTIRPETFFGENWGKSTLNLEPILMAMKSSANDRVRPLVTEFFTRALRAPNLTLRGNGFESEEWQSIESYCINNRLFDSNYFESRKKSVMESKESIDSKYVMKKKVRDITAEELANELLVKINTIKESGGDPRKQVLGVYALSSRLGAGKTTFVHDVVGHLRDNGIMMQVNAVSPLHSLSAQSEKQFDAASASEFRSGGVSSGFSVCIHSLGKVIEEEGLIQNPGISVLMLDEFPQIMGNLSIENNLIKPETQDILSKKVAWLLDSTRVHQVGAYSPSIVFINSADFNDYWVETLRTEPFNTDIDWINVMSTKNFSPVITITTADSAWMDLKVAANNRKRTFIVTDTVKNTLTAEQIFLQSWPDARILVIHNSKGTATVGDNKVKAFFSSPNYYQTFYDCIICSPAIQSGVSIINSYFQAHFQFVSGSTITPNDLGQQIARDRNAKMITVGLELNSSLKGLTETNKSVLPTQYAKIPSYKLRALTRWHMEMANVFENYVSLLSTRYTVIFKLDAQAEGTEGKEERSIIAEDIHKNGRQQILNNIVVDKTIVERARKGLGDQAEINGAVNFDIINFFKAKNIEDCIDLVGSQTATVDKIVRYVNFRKHVETYVPTNGRIDTSQNVRDYEIRRFYREMISLVNLTDYEITTNVEPMSATYINGKIAEWIGNTENASLFEEMVFLRKIKPGKLTLKVLQQFLVSEFGISLSISKAKKTVSVRMAPKSSKTKGLVSPGMYILAACLHEQAGSYAKLNEFVSDKGFFVREDTYPIFVER